MSIKQINIRGSSVFIVVLVLVVIQAVCVVFFSVCISFCSYNMDGGEINPICCSFLTLKVGHKHLLHKPEGRSTKQS